MLVAPTTMTSGDWRQDESTGTVDSKTRSKETTCQVPESIQTQVVVRQYQKLKEIAGTPRQPDKRRAACVADNHVRLMAMWQSLGEAKPAVLVNISDDNIIDIKQYSTPACDMTCPTACRL